MRQFQPKPTHKIKHEDRPNHHVNSNKLYDETEHPVLSLTEI